MGNNDGQDKDLNPGPLNLRPGALPIEKSGNGIQTSLTITHVSSCTTSLIWSTSKTLKSLHVHYNQNASKLISKQNVRGKNPRLKKPHPKSK